MPKLNDRRTIGIWIELNYGELGSEGIGRLLRFVIEGATKLGYRFIIACPSWYRQHLEVFIQEFDQQASAQVTVICARTQPSFFNKFKPARVKSRSKLKVPITLARFVKDLTNWLTAWCSRQTLPVLVLTAILFAPVLIPLGILFLVYMQLLAIRQFVRGSQHPWLVRVRKHARGMRAFYKERLRRILKQLHELSVEQEYAALAARASKVTDAIAWYVPNPSWWHCRLINRPVVVAVPDFVIEELPLSFVEEERPALYKRNIKRSLKAATCSISFRDYVKNKHVVDLFQFPADRAFVIPHAPVDLSSYINDLGDYVGDKQRQMAADKIRSYFRKRFEPLVERYPFQATYLPSFAFEDARFIIISTRFRGYKNIQRVVEAVNILVRKRQFNVKVLLTGYFDDQLEDFVKENCLYYDVIPLYHVPADIHAYLYFLSGLSIHPSFFEGGFPFVFSESLSLGTPCLLANVQTVTEVIDPSVDGDFLFDPYSATDIANKIQYAFEHSTQLEQRQQRLLSTMKERSWTDVADEYVTVFERASLIWNSGEFKSLVLEDRQALAEEAVKIHTAAGN